MNGQVNFKKTRIAPTPSGFLHLGNILSFAITAALAARAGAKVLLRIDDFDMQRTNKLYIQDIFDTLNFLEIPWDEGPRNMAEYENEYSQRHRMEMYNKALHQLKEQGHLFACACSRAQVVDMADGIYPGTCRQKNLPFDAANVSWRLHTDDAKVLPVKTFPGKIINTTLPASMTDFIVRKKDGFPAYQLISVLDDRYFDVDLVVRGEDLWSSTLAQLYLASVLGRNDFMDTTFYHHPLLTGDDGNKLSKSAGATSVQYLRKEGKKPTDIYSLIAGLLHIDSPIANWMELVNAMNVKGDFI